MTKPLSLFGFAVQKKKKEVEILTPDEFKKEFGEVHFLAANELSLGQWCELKELWVCKVWLYEKPFVVVSASEWLNQS